MAGGLMQLLAYGAQDEYLTNSFPITFYKNNYKQEYEKIYELSTENYEVKGKVLTDIINTNNNEEDEIIEIIL